MLVNWKQLNKYLSILANFLINLIHHPIWDISTASSFNHRQNNQNNILFSTYSPTQFAIMLINHSPQPSNYQQFNWQKEINAIEMR